MDEIVRQAMAKWPNVPAAYGWLRLDRRGHWRLINRNAPGFDEATDGEGTRIEHAAFADFISRNYHADSHGRWFFQNGPQRVFVDLEIAPLVFRVFDAWRSGRGDDAAGGTGGTGAAAGGTGGPHAAVTLVAHTGWPVARVERGFVDRRGNVFVVTDLGPGVIHDGDLAALPIEPLDEAAGTMRLRLANGEVVLEPIDEDPAQELGFERRPREDGQAA